jgi:hypothetical protein
LVDPEFFTALQAANTDIGGVDIQIKRGLYHNELTRYRYDVVLRKHPITPLPLDFVPRLSWAQQIGGLPALDEYLSAQRPARLRVIGVPNSRVAHEVAFAHAVQAGNPLAELLEHLPPTQDARIDSTGTSQAIDPEALHELGRRCGYWVGITWSATAPEALDVVFADMTLTASTIPVEPCSPSLMPTRSMASPLRKFRCWPNGTR